MYFKNKSNVTLHKDSVAISVDIIPIWLNLREAMGASKVFTELLISSVRGEVQKKESTCLSCPFSGKHIESY